MTTLRYNAVWGFVMAALMLVIAAPAVGGGPVGKKFPNFTARDAITGKKFSLEDLRGKVVLIDFWATWCGPCVRELPNVKQAYNKYKDEGFEIVSISLDKDRNKFKRFVSSQKMTWYHVMEGGGWGTRLAKRYRIRSIPTMFLIDHEGVCISDRARGSSLESSIERALKKIPEDVKRAAPARSSSRAAEPSLDPGRAAMLRQEVDTAREELRAAAEPIRSTAGRLDQAASDLNSLAKDLPIPKIPDLARRRYTRLLEDLTDVRHAMFINGLLNERVVQIPASPFDEEGVEARRAFIAAAGQLDELQEIVEELKKAISDAKRELDTVDADLARVSRKLASDASDERVAADGEALCRTARALSDRNRDPWRVQLAESEAMFDRVFGADDEATGQYDELTEQIATCRNLLVEAASGGDPGSLRETFTEVITTVATLVKEQTSRGVIGADAIKLPGNPLDRGSLRDFRTRIAMGEALDQADAVVKQLAQSGSQSSGQVSDYQEKARALRDDLKEAGDDQNRLNDVRRQFEDLCREILEQLDGRDGA